MSSVRAFSRRAHALLRRRASSIGLGVMLAVLAVGLLSTRAAHTPQGVVTHPRLRDAYSVEPSQNAAFRFRGFVDFPGSSGRIEIDVLKRGNGENEAASWALNVATATPSNTPTKYKGKQWYAWTTDKRHIFKPGGTDENRWPEGGTARVRFRAVHVDGGHALLPVLDDAGVPGRSCELIVFFVLDELRFSSYEDFALFTSLIHARVCRSHLASSSVMPNAEQTFKLFWRSAGRPQLLDRLLITFGCGIETP